MKNLLSIFLIGFLLIVGLALLYLTNAGVLSLGKPYIYKLSKELPVTNPLVAFVNVNVVPMDSEQILESQTVLVRDGVIEQIERSEQVYVPAEAHIIDGQGKYLMPGLVDMHVHLLDENDLLLFAAHGVTTVRNLWGGQFRADHLGWRANIRAGNLLGPTLYTSGPIMEGPPKTVPFMKVYEDPESARAAVIDQIEQGYDFIKVYDYVSLPTYQAIIETAQSRGVMVVGHTPKKVGLERVLNSGQVTLEHISGFIDSDAGDYAVPENELPKYAGMAADAGVYICPTIAVYQMNVPNEDLHLLEDRPEMIYVPPRMKFIWKRFSRPGTMGNITYQGDYPARIKEMFLNSTRILHEHDVKFVLGTDVGNPYLVPGTSLLDELDYLAGAGFKPYEAIEAGTRNAAKAMGKLNEFGTIEAGKRADLILVEDNPLEDVANVRKRSGVMLNGRWFTEGQLGSMLDGLLESYRPSLPDRLWPLSLVAIALAMIAHSVRQSQGQRSMLSSIRVTIVV